MDHFSFVLLLSVFLLSQILAVSRSFPVKLKVCLEAENVMSNESHFRTSLFLLFTVAATLQCKLDWQIVLRGSLTQQWVVTLHKSPLKIQVNVLVMI